MNTLISFLRGINMAGHNSMKMIDLSNLFQDLGFNCVTTYIQSGNVIFTDPSKMSAEDVSNKLTQAIHTKFNYNIPVMIRSVEELVKIVNSNPFISEEIFEPSKMMAIFLFEKPAEAQIQKVINIDYPPDKFRIIGKEIFVYCPDGFGKTKLYTNFFEKKMGVTGSARSWKTITNVLDIAGKR
jgi:uncharacterized protein (DUF1697 family)